MKKPKPDTGSFECPADDLVPFLTGELDRDAHEKVRQHVEHCESCKTDLEEFKRVMSIMDMSKPDAECRDTAGEIVSKARGKERVKTLYGGIAAAVILFATLFTIFYVEHDAVVKPSTQPTMGSSEVRLEKAFEWLVSAQAEDGGWHAESWEGQAPYTVGITSLAVIALLNRGQVDREMPQHLQKAVEFLTGQMGEEGVFGDSTCIGLYNHSIATTALLECYAQQPGPELRRILQKALAGIAEHIKRPGSFFNTSNNTVPLSSVGMSLSVWQLNALGLGKHLGFEGCRKLYEGAGKRFLESLKSHQDSGRFINVPAYPALCFYKGDNADISLSRKITESFFRSAANRLAEEPDYYTWYALSCGLTSMDRGKITEFDTALQEQLLALQASSGNTEGSWEPVDVWSSAGGRVYSTAMAVMALNAEERFSRLAKFIK